MAPSSPYESKAGDRDEIQTHDQDDGGQEPTETTEEVVEAYGEGHSSWL
jgi:hypothetical protein